MVFNLVKKIIFNIYIWKTFYFYFLFLYIINHFPFLVEFLASINLVNLLGFLNIFGKKLIVK